MNYFPIVFTILSCEWSVYSGQASRSSRLKYKTSRKKCKHNNNLSDSNGIPKPQQLSF